MAVVEMDAEARDGELAAWAKAPSARESHPREEHLMPLMVTAGAAGTDLGKVVFRDVVMGMTVSAVRFGRSSGQRSSNHVLVSQYCPSPPLMRAVSKSAASDRARARAAWPWAILAR